MWSTLEIPWTLLKRILIDSGPNCTNNLTAWKTAGWNSKLHSQFTIIGVTCEYRVDLVVWLVLTVLVTGLYFYLSVWESRCEPNKKFIVSLNVSAYLFICLFIFYWKTIKITLGWDKYSLFLSASSADWYSLKFGQIFQCWWVNFLVNYQEKQWRIKKNKKKILHNIVEFTSWVRKQKFVFLQHFLCAIGTKSKNCWSHFWYSGQG